MDQTNRWSRKCSLISIGALVIVATTGWLVAAYYIHQAWQHYSKHVWGGCTKKTRDDCQDHIEGNACVEAHSYPYYRCNCTASGYVPHYEEQYCISVNCNDWDDMYACKTHIKGNACRMEEGVYRNCTCTAPGYQMMESRRGNVCWRTQCTSYQEDQCHADVIGNGCDVLDDVFVCTCSAAGYKPEPFRQQRCLSPTTPHQRSTTYNSKFYPIHSRAFRHLSALPQLVFICLGLWMKRWLF